MKSRVSFLICILALSGCTQSQPIVVSIDDVPSQKAKEHATVLRILDGDTVEVRMEDGAVELVRIIGIDALEMHSSKQSDCFAQEATVYLRSQIDQAKITLVPQPGDDRDKYKRLLRYIEKDDADIGAQMLRLGYARNYPWFDHPRLDLYTQIGDSAQKSGVGLWGECEGTT